MFKYILWGLFAYIMFVFLKNIVIPVARLFWRVRKQIKATKQQFEDNNPSIQEEKAEKKDINHPAFKDEYIDFEDVKLK
jgi:predicted membrane protein